MASSIRSSFIAILQAMKAQLAAITGLDASAVIIVAYDDVPHYQADSDIVLRVRGERADRDRLQGNGRVMDYRTRRVDVIARTRQMLDPVDEDEIHLTEGSLAHIALEDSIADALQMFMATDSDSNLLSACPVRVLDLTDPRRDAREQEWVSSTFSCEVDYVRALSQDRQ